MIPDEGQAMTLHRKYGTRESVVKHCQACARVSLQLSKGAARAGRRVDERVLVAGALLHDIGRSRVQTVDHGHVGAKILEEEGVDAAVVEIVRRHVGAGISLEEARSLGFPDGDYVPRTLEQRIVCFSDKMLDGEKVRPLQEEINRFVKKGHDVARLEKLRDDVGAAVGGDAEKVAMSDV